MVDVNRVQFGQFGDRRDDRPNNYSRTEMYQPEGSKNRFELHESYGNVTAHRLGKPDEILPGGRPAKRPAAALHVWKEPKEVLSVGVGKGFQGKGLGKAMLQMANDRHPDLSHSDQLTFQGALFAARNPMPGDTESTKSAQQRGIKPVADAATTLLGGSVNR